MESSRATSPIFRCRQGIDGKRLQTALVLAPAGNLFGHIDDAAPELGVGDSGERPGQPDAIIGRQELKHGGVRQACRVAFWLCLLYTSDAADE